MNRTALTVSTALAIITGGVALAQQPPAPPSGLQPPTATPRDPISLPGDMVPPPLSVVLAPPRAPATPATPATPPPPRPVVGGPTMEVALQAAQAAMAKCAADGLKVGIAVSDSQGSLVVGLQATGANPGRIFNAARKNLAAIEFAMPTSQVRQKLLDRDFDTLSRAKANMTLFPGAVPLMSGGKAIGAIGVSGATSLQDEACAAVGAATVTGKL